jgi:DNA polymerase-3 subunit beta
MNIKVNRNNLSKYLQMLQGVIEKKHTIPILSNILVESTKGNVYIVATDLDIGIRIKCDAEVIEEGNVYNEHLSEEQMEQEEQRDVRG